MSKKYMKVPKGTIVYTSDAPHSWIINPQHDESKPSTRDSVVELCWYASPTREQLQANMPKIVMWSNGTKYCLESDVELDVPAPVRKAPVRTATPKITLRQRMVKGSKWRLTAGAQVVKLVGFRDTVLDYVIPAGTEITVTGKFTTYGPGWIHGIWVPIQFNSQIGQTNAVVEFKELNQDPEQVGETVVEHQFVIWDKAKKKYYAGYEYTGWNNTGPIQYDAKLTKAKKFKRLADVRVHALIQSGYYDNLPESWGSVPDWMCGPKAFDVPDTWEIVKINKLSKEEVERIELVDTFKRSWKLRALTVKFSSAVRAVYSNLEKKGKLGEYSAMMMFGHKREKNRYWVEELTTAEKDEVNALIARFAGDAKICKTNSGFAVAVKDAMTTTMLRLAYAGSLECVMIDFNTMEEIVQQKETA